MWTVGYCKILISVRQRKRSWDSTKISNITSGAIFFTKTFYSEFDNKVCRGPTTSPVTSVNTSHTIVEDPHGEANKNDEFWCEWDGNNEAEFNQVPENQEVFLTTSDTDLSRNSHKCECLHHLARMDTLYKCTHCDFYSAPIYLNLKLILALNYLQSP